MCLFIYLSRGSRWDLPTKRIQTKKKSEPSTEFSILQNFEDKSYLEPKTDRKISRQQNKEHQIRLVSQESDEQTCFQKDKVAN